MKRISIAITAYDRVDLLKQCLVHLSSNDQRLFRVLVFPDLVDELTDRSIRSACSSVSAETGMEIHLISGPETHLHCCRNVLRSVSVTSSLNPEYIIKLDSDIIVTKDFVKVMFELSQSIDGGLATSSIICHMSKEEKRAKASEVVDISLSGSNFCVSNKWWRKIEETARPLVIRRHSNREARWPELQSIAASSNPTQPGAIAGKEYFFKEDHNIGSDAIIVLGAAVCDCPISSLVVNRATHPSPTGVHTTAEWHSANYANTFLDEIEGDATRNHFTRK